MTGRGRREPRGPLPRFNQEPGACEPDRPLEYVAVRGSDRVRRAGLAAYMQDRRCRAFARDRLHRSIEAAFMDAPGTGDRGFRRLLAHLAACRNRRVIVSRLDRLPGTARDLRPSGTRILSASERNTRGPVSQAELAGRVRETIRQMFGPRRGGRRR